MTNHLLLVLLLSVVVSVVKSDLVKLASCPQEPQVVGTFRNNGQLCVRDRHVLSRTVVAATCPSEDYKYTTKGKCRHKRKKVEPTCPPAYQLYKKSGECRSPCPSGYSVKYDTCILRKATLNQNYMTCDSPEANIRQSAYCCSGDDCPVEMTECQVGPAVPGKFYYDSATRQCHRQAESLVREYTSLIPQQEREGLDDNPSPNLRRTCPAGKERVLTYCQDPCPPGFKTKKGKCELKECTFELQLYSVLTKIKCPEGLYHVSQSTM